MTWTGRAAFSGLLGVALLAWWVGPVGGPGRLPRVVEPARAVESAMGDVPPATVQIGKRGFSNPPIGPPRRVAKVELVPAPSSVPLQPLKPAEFEEVWTSESADPEWTKNLENYITAMLELDELELDLIESIDCRETLCRVALYRQGNDPTIMRLGHMLMAEGYPFRLPPETDKDLVTVYIAREEFAETRFIHVDAGVK